MDETFLSGSVLAGYLGTGLLPFPEALRTPAFLGPVAALALFVELFIAVFIWRPRFRPTAFVLGFGLHLSIILFMADTLKLVVFALVMLALYPLFLPEERVDVTWVESSKDGRLITRLRRMDVLGAIEALPVSSPTALTVGRDGGVVTGFDAVERILERVVPTLWVAPLLRLPGIRGLGRRWYQRSRAVSSPVES
jgi:hypothetical protein